MPEAILRWGVLVPPPQDRTIVLKPPPQPPTIVLRPPPQPLTTVLIPGASDVTPSASRMLAKPSTKEAGKKAISLAKQVLGDTFNNSISPKARRSVAAAVNELARRALDPDTTDVQRGKLLELGQQLIVAGRDAKYLRPDQGDFAAFVAAMAQPPAKPSMPPPGLPAISQPPADAPSQQLPPSKGMCAPIQGLPIR
ncbi:MAG: hypothetical protein NTW15_05015 [Burkholderiales bacterium]|nr:hypothetical protein [Burkholderiales bacterium]